MSSMAAVLPRSLSRRFQIYRMAAQLKRRGSRTLADLPATIEQAMDAAKLRRLWEEVEPEYRRSPTCAAKYAIPREWLLLNALRAGELGLDAAAGLRILDIGCGPAFFVAVTRALGHQTEGVDAPPAYMTVVEQRVYSRLIEILKCEQCISPLLIERYIPLPYADERFDLITAFWICFNRHRQPDEWGPEEWRFFVEDAVRKLRPGGRLYLDLNENPERYGELRFYDAPTLEYFRSVGTVDGGRVLVKRGS